MDEPSYRLRSAGRSRLNPTGGGAMRATSRQRQGLCLPPQDMPASRRVRWGWAAAHTAAWAEGLAMVLLGDVAGLIPLVISGALLAKEFPWKKTSPYD